MGEVEAHWRRTDGSWRERLMLRSSADGMAAEGEIFDATPEQPWLRYTVTTDRRFQVTEAVITARNGSRIALAAEEAVWRDADTGHALPELEGCIDIDLQATPFTNTLPIRRLHMRADDHADIVVVYIDHATLSPRTFAQHYTCVRPYQTGDGCYRYTSATFEAELRVDRDGLVHDYPPFWTREA